MDLRGKRTLMTGVTGGLGPALVEAFLALGSHVLATGRRRTALDELRAQMRHHDRLDVAECDLRDGDGVEALFDAWTRQGDADVVVHAAGAYAAETLEDTDDASMQRVIDGNLRTAALVLRAALRRMREAERGSVVVVAASRAQDPGTDEALYGAAKAAVVHLVESTATAGGGVRINALLPGPIDTEENRRAGLDGVPASDVARAAVWLASDESRGINGASVRLS
ncbi:MAG TPA: SDR family oxidoreductase [Sandaracinaceae bacterium LLY-WYZ-13_1]|nr:SDR family oxidoreductase [Sandaracinaceae bacterium LLY-WYZ-13_1]